MNQMNRKVLLYLFHFCNIICFSQFTLFFYIRTSNFAAEAEPKLNVSIFSRFEPKTFFARL